MQRFCRGDEAAFDMLYQRYATPILGAGTAGALLGELACHRGGAHVLVHHVGAWLAIVAVCVLVSRRARPRTFAP